MKINTVIFDLDGTLIDSAPSILKSIKFAFDATKIEPIRPLTLDLIGPPINEIFLSLVSENKQIKLPKLIENFKQYYDEIGYKETQMYMKTTEMLDELLSMNLKLFIATNKRIKPTQKIIKHLGWKEKFDKVFTLDYFEPALKNKNIMLGQIYKDLTRSGCAIYVGDRAEDAEAAAMAGFPFFYASWGYESEKMVVNDFYRLIKPSVLPLKIKEYLLY
jgi:phosphoglycolate phosphatase